MSDSPYSLFIRDSRRDARLATAALTLVELLIAVSLASLLLLALFSTWRMIAQSAAEQARQTELHLTATAVLDRIAEDLRQAAPHHFPGPALTAAPPGADARDLSLVLSLLTHAPLRAGGPPASERPGMTWVRYSLCPQPGGAGRLLAMERRIALYAQLPGEEDPVDEAERLRVDFPLPVSAWEATYRTPDGAWAPAWSDPTELPSAVRLRLVCGEAGATAPAVVVERTVLIPAGPMPEPAADEAVAPGGRTAGPAAGH